MRRPTKTFKATQSSAEIRARFRWLKKTLVGLIIVSVIAWLLGQIFLPDQVIFFVIFPYFAAYVLFCHACGRLANCFGESTLSWTLTVLVFSLLGIVLGYFAFKDGVIRAHAEGQ